ncbi:hypothetical protein LTR86_008055 [Recurvomyces mirabilis]|nr:hypothetical protein LTR86_008055 [Recurvomyces mirabilis]
MPFHQSNTNPNVAVGDPALVMTHEGPVYSKRRMVIVLWIYERDMFCLPLYTHNKTGLTNKGNVMHEYVSIKNAGKPHINQGRYPPVEVVPKYRDMDSMSVVQMSGGLRVGCNEDVSWAGRTTKAGYENLLALWRTLSNGAQKDAWDP